MRPISLATILTGILTVGVSVALWQPAGMVIGALVIIVGETMRESCRA